MVNSQHIQSTFIKLIIKQLKRKHIKYKVVLKRNLKLLLKVLVLGSQYILIRNVLLIVNKIEMLAYQNACETFGCKEK